MVFDVSLEMQSDSKNYVSVQDDDITELVHTTKSQWSLSDCRSQSQIDKVAVRNIYRIQTEILNQTY